MLVLDNINTFYGYSHVLHSVSLEVNAGEIMVLLGRNGVGKTTTLKSIMGIRPPKSGRIIFQGQDITGLPPHRVARQGISLIPEERRIIPNLTVAENLKLGMLIRGKEVDRAATMEMVFQYFPRLKERISQLGGSLSGGEQQMLTIARALVANPRLMMIDEPSEGLMPLMVAEIANIIKKLQQDGVTILLVEQNYRMALGLSDNQRAYIMEKGQIRMSGTPGQLQERQEEVERYLGVKI